MIQAMTSQAGGGSGRGYAGSAQRGQTQGLTRQGSLCSLTLDEVQNQLGEPLLSMNLDELLKSVFPDAVDTDGGGGVASQSEQALGLQRQGSIVMPPKLSKKTLDELWKGIQDAPKRSAEKGGQRRQESFLMAWPAEAGEFPEGIKSVFPEGVGTDGGGGFASQSEQASGLQRQGSIAMPPELSKKTLDELWKGIQDAPKRSAEEGGQRRQERQLTLGEMTLEDFLVKAGVVMEGYLKDSNDLPANMDAVGSSVIAAGVPNLNHEAQWLQQYQQQALEPQHPSMAGSYMASHLGLQPLAVGTGAILESIYSDGQSSSPMLGALSDPQTPGRKRSASGAVPDKVVERRQKRMIKNRESAARSRARKQAYTNELENKVSRLEEENERLKRQKELNKILFSAPPPEPKYQLRRTSSSPV